MSVRERIRAFIGAELMHRDAATLGDDEPLLQLGVLDSLGLQRMLAFLEQEYRVRLPDAEITPDHFESIRSIATLVEKHRKG